MSPEIESGFGSQDITPHLGSEIPGAILKNCSVGVHDQLLVTSLLLNDNHNPLVIVGVDALALNSIIVSQAREEINKRLSIPKENVLIAASHTHEGGPTTDIFLSKSDSSYSHLVAERISLATEKAFKTQKKSVLKVGSSLALGVSFNRRFIMKDGSIQTHPGKPGTKNYEKIVRPAGPVDPQVGVIGIFDQTNQLKGCLINFSCHATTRVGGYTLNSADYIHYLRRGVKLGARSHQATVIFINGAEGDITQVNNLDARPKEYGEFWGQLVGINVAGAAISALASGKEEKIDLLARSNQIMFQRRDPNNKELNQIKEFSSRYNQDAEIAAWSEELQKYQELFNLSSKIEIEIQTMKITDRTGIISLPVELFCQLGLDIKSNSPFSLTMLAMLANGFFGYAPTQNSFPYGYECRTARSSQLIPGDGERLSRLAAEQLKDLI